jgi:hypothetical protein
MDGPRKGELGPGQSKGNRKMENKLPDPMTPVILGRNQRYIGKMMRMTKKVSLLIFSSQILDKFSLM